MGTSFSEIKAIKHEIRDEYLADHQKPWVIGFSGGKDSTLVTQLVVEVLLSLHPSERRRRVYVVYNDTLVESPVFQSFVTKSLEQIRSGVSALDLPVEVETTKPPLAESFWVNLLGKGYPAPNRNFRWCMDRLKIKPSAKFIVERIKEFGEVILLLGVRRAESAARQQRMDAYTAASDNQRLVPNTDIANCQIFRPIKDLTTDEVWEYLQETPPPWGSNASLSLVSLYQDAGMCNATQTCALMDEVTVNDSGSILARFGCWTCTVVRRDRSLESLVENGYPELEPLIAFRERMREISDTPRYRSKIRRNGSQGLGPLTFAAREILLNELLEVQRTTEQELITSHEVRLIREQWEIDKNTEVIRNIP